jgi:serine protease
MFVLLRTLILLLGIFSMCGGAWSEPDKRDLKPRQAVEGSHSAVSNLYTDGTVASIPDYAAKLRRVANPIPGQYIVLYEDSAFQSIISNSTEPSGKAGQVSNAQMARSVKALNTEVAQQFGAEVKAEWSRAAKGMAVRMSAVAAAKLAQDPRVLMVEEDFHVRANLQTQTPAAWGLDRIDQRDLPLNNKYGYENTGSGVTAYIIDTGILLSHEQFGGRAIWGTNTVDSNNTDCHGHGTHVAGTVGGTTYGVAKDVTLVAVKVLDCDGSGSVSGVISGINWAVQDMQTNNRIAVANMSLGGGYSLSENTVVDNAVAAGLVMAVAAGNETDEACSYSPASAASALTVGATAINDSRSSFSNYGSCVDLFAPGTNITSASIASNTATATWSGTSMASPHVAGAAALYREVHLSDTAVQVSSYINGNATVGKVTDPLGSPNRLLYTLYDGLIQVVVSKTGTGSGTVVSSPAGINCGSDCSETYDGTSTANISLQATTGSGDTFEGWSGDCSGTSTTCQVTLDGSKNVIATFTAPTPELGNGETLSNLSGASGSWVYYRMDVPSGASNLLIATSGGTGDVDLYVKQGGAPTLNSYDCRPYSNSNNETCNFSTPAAGMWWTGLHGYSSYSGVSLSASYRLAGTRYQLTVTNPGNGNITSSPAGINCGSTCSALFNSGTAVTLTATPASGYTFTGWTGDCSGAGACTLTMTSNKNVGASFAQSPYLLSITNPGNGNITSSPAGINCGSTCSAPFNSGTAVTLTATPASGFTFTGWTGDCSGAGACTLTMTSNKNVGASFALIPVYYSLNVSINGSGSLLSDPAGVFCSGSCSATYLSGTNVSLYPTAAGGYYFTGWSGACSGIGSCQVNMTNNRSVTATFAVIPQTGFTLTVTKTGNGYISSLSPNASINCGINCQSSFAAGQLVTLFAQADRGHTFMGWSGQAAGLCGRQTSCDVYMSSNQTISGDFKNTYLLILPAIQLLLE